MQFRITFARQVVRYHTDNDPFFMPYTCQDKSGRDSRDAIHAIRATTSLFGVHSTK